MNRDTQSNATSRPAMCERHRSSGAEVARMVLHRRLNRTAHRDPAAILGVLAYWLGPQDAGEPDARRS
jgi:hypothetical protein